MIETARISEAETAINFANFLSPNKYAMPILPSASLMTVRIIPVTATLAVISPAENNVTTLTIVASVAVNAAKIHAR